MPVFKPRAVLCLICCLLMLFSAAYAEDCFTIDVDSLDLSRLDDNAYVEQNLTAQTQGLRVVKTISDSNELAARVRLTIRQAETDTLVFDKNYGYVGGTFDSGNIYLPYVDNNLIPYLVTLTVEDTTYAVPFMHQQPRLTNNSGCTYGVRLKELNPSLTDGWVMGTMLDLASLRSTGVATIPVCASNLYVVGQATVRVSGDELTVSLTFDPAADVTLLASAVYVVGDVGTLSSVSPSRIGQPAYAPEQGISIAGMDTALMYLPLTLSYNAAGLSEFAYDAGGADLTAQKALWDANLQAHETP
jgi:hypothetical protein